MALVPFIRKNANPLERLHNEMDDLFDGFFRGLDRPFAGYQAWPASADPATAAFGPETAIAACAAPPAPGLPAPAAGLPAPAAGLPAPAPYGRRMRRPYRAKIV